MRKALILGAVALLLAVGAASTHRLRYDSSVFTGKGELTQTRQREVREYPPCIKGVREDRCIQLYERGMRRAYDRWLAERGLTRRDRHASARAYPPCRSRSDDRCQQRSARNRVRTARSATPVRTARRGQQQRTVARTAAVRRATPRRATPARATARRTAPATRAATRAPARAVTPRPQQPRPTTRPQTPPRQPPLPNTPGI